MFNQQRCWCYLQSKIIKHKLKKKDIEIKTGKKINVIAISAKNKNKKSFQEKQDVHTLKLSTITAVLR